MPLPFFWICMGITTVTIGAIVAYEAHVRYTHFREQQEYERYARQYAENHPPPSFNQHEFKESDSSDDEDKDKDMNEENNVKHFVRDLNDNSELRRRVPRSKSPPLTTNDEPNPNNRPVSDKSWVDDTEYELNEMEQKLTLKKQYIERQQELLDKAEMDLERRWQLHQSRSSDILEQMSSSSYASDHKQRDTSNTPSTSSSFLSMNTSTQKSTDYELSKGTTSLLSAQSHTSSANDHMTTTFSTATSGIQIYSSMDESAGRLTPTKNDGYNSQEQSSTSFVSVSPSPLQSIINTDNNATSASSSSPNQQQQQQQQQQTSDSSIGLNTETPWCFEDDDDDNDETTLSLHFQNSMRFPSGSNSSNINPSISSESQHGSTDWDEHSLTNDMLSLSSHETSSSLANHETNSLLSPSVPSSSSSDGGSYDLIHGSDLDNGP